MEFADDECWMTSARPAATRAEELVQPTYIGGIAALFGILMMSRSMTAMLLLAISTTIFGAASAVNATALGGASIQPPMFLLAFLALRILRSGDAFSHRMEMSLRDTAVFGVFVLYGVVSSHIFPRLFFHQIEVVPTRFVATQLYAIAPLEPSSQNITQAAYLCGTFLTLLATVLIARAERRSRLVAMSMIALAWAHILFGVVDVISTSSLEFLRNANYAIVTQEISGFHRIQGTFAETSSYATYGFVLLVFITELWLRQIEPKLTGWTTLVLAAMLFFSTSSSAYVGMGVYGLVLGFRMVYFPSTVGQRKALILALLGVLTIMMILSLLVAVPAFVDAFGDILKTMTTEKLESESGLQRGFWNEKAWEAFFFSNGLGVGVGSFRSSSLISAIAGATGVVGLVTFLYLLYRILPVHRLAIYRLDMNKTEAVGAAASWAAVVGIAPAFVAATNPDPGLMWAFMAGLSIAWAPHLAHARSGAQPATA